MRRATWRLDPEGPAGEPKQLEQGVVAGAAGALPDSLDDRLEGPQTVCAAIAPTSVESQAIGAPVLHPLQVITLTQKEK